MKQGAISDLKRCSLILIRWSSVAPHKSFAGGVSHGERVAWGGYRGRVGVGGSWILNKRSTCIANCFVIGKHQFGQVTHFFRWIQRIIIFWNFTLKVSILIQLGHINHCAVFIYMNMDTCALSYIIL